MKYAARFMPDLIIRQPPPKALGMDIAAPVPSSVCSSPAPEMTFCVIRTPYPATEQSLPHKKTLQNKKKQRISPLLFSGLYPPPGTLPNPNLLQRGLSSGAGGDRNAGDLAHYRILNRAEGVHARTILAHRACPRGIATGRARHRERIAALGASRQCGIDHAGARRGRHEGTGASA